MPTLPSPVSSEKPTLGKPFSVPCPYHVSHRWEWCVVRSTGISLAEFHALARVQMSTLCPEIGNVLTWCGFRPDEPWDGLNWTLRRGVHARNLDDDEIAIARCCW